MRFAHVFCTESAARSLVSVWTTIYRSRTLGVVVDFCQNFACPISDFSVPGVQYLRRIAAA